MYCSARKFFNYAIAIATAIVIAVLYSTDR